MPAVCETFLRAYLCGRVRHFLSALILYGESSGPNRSVRVKKKSGPKAYYSREDDQTCGGGGTRG